MDLSILVVSWNTRDILCDCLESIYRCTTNMQFEIFVVDNNSSDGTSQTVKEKYPAVRLINNFENAGFARANNQALGNASGRYVVLLNPDTLCHDGALEKLVAFLDNNPDAGIVGPLVLNPDGTLQYSWARFPGVMDEIVGRLDRYIRDRKAIPKSAESTRQLGQFETDWVGGCCLVARSDAIKDVGFLDEDLFMYSEEMDWCYRFKKLGWSIWVQPEAEIVHLGGQSSSQASEASKKYLRNSKRVYFRKHKGPLAGWIVGCVHEFKACANRLIRG